MSSMKPSSNTTKKYPCPACGVGHRIDYRAWFCYPCWSSLPKKDQERVEQALYASAVNPEAQKLHDELVAKLADQTCHSK